MPTDPPTPMKSAPQQVSNATVLGYPRIGRDRALNKATEALRAGENRQPLGCSVGSQLRTLTRRGMAVIAMFKSDIDQVDLTSPGGEVVGLTSSCRAISAMTDRGVLAVAATVPRSGSYPTGRRSPAGFAGLRRRRVCARSVGERWKQRVGSDTRGSAASGYLDARPRGQLKLATKLSGGRRADRVARYVPPPKALEGSAAVDVALPRRGTPGLADSACLDRRRLTALCGKC